MNLTESELNPPLYQVAVEVRQAAVIRLNRQGKQFCEGHQSRSGFKGRWARGNIDCAINAHIVIEKWIQRGGGRSAALSTPRRRSRDLTSNWPKKVACVKGRGARGRGIRRAGAGLKATTPTQLSCSPPAACSRPHREWSPSDLMWKWRHHRGTMCFVVAVGLFLTV